VIFSTFHIAHDLSATELLILYQSRIKVPMQLFDAQGKRLYLTAEERSAFMGSSQRLFEIVR
jgi:hypothetical protein